MEISFWEQDAMVDAEHIVIGAGIIGLQTALELRARRPQDRIIVLERGVLPSGASTRNAGFACFGSVTEILADIDELGEAAALALVERRWLGLQRLRARLTDADLDYQGLGGSELIFEAQRSALERVDHVNQLLQPIFGRPAFFIDDERLRQSRFGASVEALIHTPLEGQIHSGKALRALARKAAGAGIEILTGANVHAMEEGDGEVRVRVEADRSLTFRAAQVVVCASGMIRKLLPEMAVTPGRGQVVVTSPIADLPLRGTFHSHQGYNYFRNVGNRVLLGGARHLDFDAEQTDVLDISAGIQTALEQMLREVILPEREFTIEHRWAGLMGFSADGLPVVRAVSPRVWVGFGCNGMGVALGAEIAHAAATMMTDS